MCRDIEKGVHEAEEVGFVSRNQSIVVFQSEEGFTVVELLGGEGLVQVGDRTFGDWGTEGVERMKVGKRSLDVCFQVTFGGAVQAMTMARQMGGG